MTDKMTVDEALEKSCVCSDGLCPACERFTTMFATLRDELARVRGELEQREAIHEICQQARLNALKKLAAAEAERDALRADVIALAKEREDGYRNREHGGVLNGRVADKLVTLAGALVSDAARAESGRE